MTGFERERVHVPFPFPAGDALCTTDPESWQPARGMYDNKAAIRVCMNCELQPACLEWALANKEVGIWGGTTERTRNAMRKKRAGR